MIYITEEEKVKELSMLVSQFQFYCTLDIIGILDEYERSRWKGKNPIPLLEYLKNYV